MISRRSKWSNKAKDLVLIVDVAIWNQWMRGRVNKVITGKDGKVRQVWVRTTNGELKRPAVKVALLDVVDSGKPEVGNSSLLVGECDDEHPSAGYQK